MLKKTAFKIIFLAVFMTAWMSGAHAGFVAGPDRLYAAPPPVDGVIVYQFHRRFRCEACHTLEAAINKALKTHFPEELQSGKLVYRVVDLDAEGSGHYEKDYEFFYNTVIVVDVDKGTETRFKNLEEIWEKLDDEDVIIEFIKSHVEEYM